MSDPFAKPPSEVIRFLKAKGLKESYDWRDLSFDEHALSFTVAKSAGYDILGDVKGALEKAIEERQDFDAFKQALTPLLKQKGWWGKKDVVDPVTGETKTVQLGSTRRLRTIYWANTRTAYGAGQWERAWRTRRALPYLIYVISTAEHKRPLHLTWVGTILPVEHEWWDTHYPPSAWGCMCRVRQCSEYEAQQAGYDPQEPPPDDGLTYSWVNKRTGEVERVPLGVDPGWGRNPGKTRFENASNLIAGKLDAMDEESRRIAAQDLAGSWLARRMIANDIPYTPGDREPANLARGKLSTPVASIDDELAAALGAQTRVVRLSVADATKQFGVRKTKGGDLSVTPDEYPVIQKLIDTGEVIQQGDRDLVLQGEIDGLWWLGVLRRADSAPDEVYLKSLHRTQLDKLDKARRRGTVLREGK